MSTLVAQTISNGTVSTSSANVIQGSAKAWVNFNGTGTVAIRSSYNVSSITDNGTGDYTVNFTNALADANYATVITLGSRTGGWALAQSAIVGAKSTGDFIGSYSTTAVSLIATTTSAYVDRDVICVSVFD